MKNSILNRIQFAIITLILTIGGILNSDARVKWSIEGGVGSSCLTGLPGKSEHSIAYRIGPTAIIPIKGWFSIRPGIMLSHKGGILDGYYGNEQITAAKIPISLNFLEIPVMCVVRVPIFNKYGFILKAGPYVGIGMWGKTKVKPDNGPKITMPGNLFSSGCDYFGNAQTSNKTAFELPRLNRWDAGLIYGVDFEFCRHYEVGANISWGIARLSPRGLTDNIGEAIAQIFFGMGRLRPITAMISFTYIF